MQLPTAGRWQSIDPPHLPGPHLLRTCMQFCDRALAQSFLFLCLTCEVRRSCKHMRFETKGGGGGGGGNAKRVPFCRLFPALIVIGLMIVRSDSHEWLAVLLFVNNYVGGLKCMPQTWLVAVLFQLYIVTPVLIFICVNNKVRENSPVHAGSYTIVPSFICYTATQGSCCLRLLGQLSGHIVSNNLAAMPSLQTRQMRKYMSGFILLIFLSALPIFVAWLFYEV